MRIDRVRLEGLGGFAGMFARTWREGGVSLGWRGCEGRVYRSGIYVSIEHRDRTSGQCGEVYFRYPRPQIRPYQKLHTLEFRLNDNQLEVGAGIQVACLVFNLLDLELPNSQGDSRR